MRVAVLCGGGHFFAFEENLTLLRVVRLLPRMLSRANQSKILATFIDKKTEFCD
jgi:hypothetical protein